MTTFGGRAIELAHAAALLGWRPAEFWEATPDELWTALGLGGEDEAMKRSEMEQLLALFPDNREA